jgi:hypothetical protein
MLVEFCSSQKFDFDFEIWKLMQEIIKKVEYGDEIIILRI